MRTGTVPLTTATRGNRRTTADSLASEAYHSTGIVVVVLPVPHASARVSPSLATASAVKAEVVQVLDAQTAGWLAKHASETILRSLLDNLGRCVVSSSTEDLLNALPGPLASADREAVPLTGGGRPNDYFLPVYQTRYLSIASIARNLGEPPRRNSSGTVRLGFSFLAVSKKCCSAFLSTGPCRYYYIRPIARSSALETSTTLSGCHAVRGGGLTRLPETACLG